MGNTVRLYADAININIRLSPDVINGTISKKCQKISKTGKSMKEFLTKKVYNKGWGNGYRAGWDASLDKMQELLRPYKDLHDDFAKYRSAMNDVIELAEKLKGKV